MLPDSHSQNHDFYHDEVITDILANTKTIAMLGASANEVRPSWFVMRYLLQKGFDVIPINPGQAGGEILGQKVYAKLADVPVPIDMVDVFRPSTALPGIIDEVLALPNLPKVLWTQLTIRDDEQARRAEEAGITVIQNRCPKIEFARLSGEIGWTGVASGVISSRKPILMKGVQSFGLPNKSST
jgi:uncharacterized protein